MGMTKVKINSFNPEPRIDGYTLSLGRVIVLWGVLYLFVAAMILFFVSTAYAQNVQAPFRTQQINTTYYVGQANLATIQKAVTTSCASTAGGRVLIQTGIAPPDTIGAVTGGCAKAPIVDERGLPDACYTWSGSAYVVGTCASGSGGASPVVAGSSQFSNALQTAPISGGLFNEEAFNTANNGITAAQLLGLKNILQPSTSTSTENLLTALTVNGSHLHNEQFGALLDYYFNSDAPVSETKWCVDNKAAASPTTENHNGCHQTLVISSESGLDLTGTPTQYLADSLQAVFFGNGIHQGRSTNVLAYTDDDFGGDYLYMHVRGAALAGASEGSVLGSKQGVEDGNVGGTLLSGGSGATTVQTSLTNGGMANSAYIIFPSENVASGYITAYTFGPGDTTLGFVTTTDTHAISSGYGFLTAICGTNTNANTPVSVTCPFSTGTVAGHTGFGSFSAGGLVMVADWHGPECAVVTSVGGGNITFSLARQHPINVPIYQGTGTCAKAMQGRGASPVYGSTDGFTPNYQTAGARTTTTWDLIFPVKNGQNGQNAIPLYGPITAHITSASQTGTTVTLTISDAGSLFNHYTAPSGASICVSGNSTSGFNQCGITGITASNGGSTLTYTVGSSASISGTGGIINVGTVSLPASNGLGNYEIDCGALVTKINGADLLHQKGTGSVDLQQNNCTMATSEAFIQLNNPAQFFQATREGWQSFTQNPGFGGNYLHQMYMEGGAWSAGRYFVLNSDDPIGAFGGWGGNQSPRTFLDTGNEVGIGTLFDMKSAPIGTPNSASVGGSLFHVGNFQAGGVETSYSILDLDTNPGSLFLRADVTTNTLHLIGQGMSPTFAVDGGINADGVVSAGGGGFSGKYIHTHNLNSDPEPPATFDEQYVVDNFCRGIHITQGDASITFMQSQICLQHNFSGGDVYDLIFNVGWNLSRVLTLEMESAGNKVHGIFAGDVTTNGDINLIPNGGTNRTLKFGASLGVPAIELFNSGSSIYGFGIQSGELQSFIFSGHFSWNKGGYQPSGTNELARLDDTGAFSVIGSVTTPSASVLTSTTTNDLAFFDNITGHIADSGILKGALVLLNAANQFDNSTQTFGLTGSGETQIGNTGIHGINTSLATTYRIDNQTGGIQPGVYVVATLPAAGSINAGSALIITDATTFTPGTCTGGGSDYMIAVTNGTTWSCH